MTRTTWPASWMPRPGITSRRWPRFSDFLIAPGGAFRQIVRGVWAHLLAYNLLCAVMAVAAAEVGIEPREVSFKGAKQAVTAFAPQIEAAVPEDRPALIVALLAVVAYHRAGDRRGRWEPRARKPRRKPGAHLHEPRAATK